MIEDIKTFKVTFTLSFEVNEEDKIDALHAATEEFKKRMFESLEVEIIEL